MATTFTDGAEGSISVGAAVVRVLLVEDDATIARATEKLIRRAAQSACEVIVVDSAEAAILLIGCEDFDLVVSDYNLAGPRTGADVLAAVQADARRTPFLFVSSDETIASLGVPYLEKPCSPSALRTTVRELLEDPPKVVREMPLDGQRGAP